MTSRRSPLSTGLVIIFLTIVTVSAQDSNTPIVAMSQSVSVNASENKAAGANNATNLDAKPKLNINGSFRISVGD